MCETTSITLEVLTTGSLRCRPSMLSQPATRSIFLRRLRVITDTSWSQYIPIHVFLISHPEGYILFDTGMSPNCNDWGYFPLWMPTFRMTAQMLIDNEEGVGEQLRSRGIVIGGEEAGVGSGNGKKLKAVVVSHLHHDHAGGLNDVVPGAPVFVTKEHWEFENEDRLNALIDGAVPERWPKDWTPNFLEPSGPPIGPWEKRYPITSDGRIVAVDTPGHNPGHVSLIVYGDEATYFLTGDATYSLESLDKEETDGVISTPLIAVESVKKIKEFCRGTKCVVLPSHDRETIKRAKEKEVYVPTTL
ncbi:Metallo-hydrolase/oxidoreductase [Mollisia scopiformis]|uniref:Metallo-hydrolase/oxidoreductase n=1 Tax=Mollisia scopiformis TaxID=149040 RepID=A0A194XFX8_MOLSC|nr:Metallo-hydrolase/oxidoreductase [Mollisia scopiformis]KUJ19046.1 Metallo-hydrolase/oxidoreductase [Mollisia scopiformis]